MSRYLVLLETHLPPALVSALHDLVEQANAAGQRMYVTGSTMRDVLAGLQARELDLVVEGDPGKLKLPADLPVHLTVSAVEQPSKAGGRAKLAPCSIHDYLRSRDFSVNAIALSATRASRGLLLDPTNGAADIESRELRALSSQTFQTRPVKMLALLGMKVRLGFATYPRTQSQFDEALESGAHRRIKPADLRAELESVAAEPKALEILQAWEAAGILPELLPEISGEALNSAGFARLQKARQAVPFGIEFPVDDPALFFHVLTENLTPKQRAAFLTAAGMDSDPDWMKLGRRVSKAEKELAGAAIHKPSQIYEVLSKAGPTVTLLLAEHSSQRVVQERVKNFLTRYLPTAKEAKPGESVAKLLDARPKKVAATVGGDTVPSVS